MVDTDFDLLVQKEMAELVPIFIANRRKDAELLRAALAAGDLETVESVAHRIKGSGSAYGFPAATEVARRIERAAAAGQESVLAPLIEEYATYISTLASLS
jgi:HPt (histidine-containing phosphotransfer) domain-containing protein